MAQFTLDGITYSRFRDVPGAVYTRSGVEYQQNAAGVWTPFDNDVPPISSGVGVDVWEARTNSIRNPTGLGAVAGVVGAGGVLPTNWVAQYNPSAVNIEVLPVGTENGLPTIDLRFWGTWGATGQANLGFDGSVSIVANNGETWTEKFFARKIAGSFDGISQITVNLAQHTAIGGYVAATASADLVPSLNSASLVPCAVQATFAGGATVARTQPQIEFRGPSGQTFDMTLRIAAPNLKLGADIKDPPILQTNNAAATRGNPTMYINAPGLLVPPFTVQVWAQLPALDGVARALVQIDDGSNTNRIFLQRSSGNAASMGTAGGSGGVPTAFSGKTGARLLKMAARVRSTELALACDGAAPNSASGVTLPPNLSRVLLGGNASAQFYPNGAIQRFQIINRDVTDAELQALTV